MNVLIKRLKKKFRSLGIRNPFERRKEWDGEQSTSRLGDLFNKHGSDKEWNHHYASAYERFLPSVGEVVLVEIGVDEGASVRAWRDYFGGRLFFLGLDIAPRMKHADHSKNIFIFKGDAGRAEGFSELLQFLKENNKEIDAVIDDGSHEVKDQKVSFLTLMPHLKKGGVYFIEDVLDETEVCKFIKDAGHEPCGVSEQLWLIKKV